MEITLHKQMIRHNPSFLSRWVIFCAGVTDITLHTGMQHLPPVADELMYEYNAEATESHFLHSAPGFCTFTVSFKCYLNY